MFFHLAPDIVRYRDAITVKVHAECSDNVCLSTEANGCAQRLARQHVCTVQLTIDNAVEQDFPVSLSFQSDVQTFFFEITFFIGDGQRSHVGQLDKTKLQFFFFCPFFSGHQWR